jgi:Fe-S cluster biogenesis protein NfuA
MTLKMGIERKLREAIPEVDRSRSGSLNGFAK